jgi:Fe-S-cluster-containing hydrogenase component 2
MKASVTVERCDRSPGCMAARVCPRGAIVPVPGGTYPGASGFTVDGGSCTGCGVCVRACPFGAVEMKG